VSNPADNKGGPAEGAAFDQLEGAIDQALTQVSELRQRTRAAESRTGELESLLERFSSGQENPGDYEERLRTLEALNGDLVGRLEKGREGVERLLARIRFLEEQK
jgi:chromosome segregation ATPase